MIINTFTQTKKALLDRSGIFFVIFLLNIFFLNHSYADPQRKIPEEYLDSFTLNRKIPVFYSYRDDSYPSDKPILYLKKDVDKNIKQIKNGKVSYYGNTDKWLYHALKKYPIKDKELAIIGSSICWYESVILAFGGKPTTIEYNKILTDDPRLTLLTVEEFNNNPKKFDIVLSISSVEHDGLGRYGDPINPNGDLEFMSYAKAELLKETGYMILAMPIGKDTLVWNLHRIYGDKRFKLLTEGWDIIYTFGFDQSQPPYLKTLLFLQYTVVRRHVFLNRLVRHQYFRSALC